MRVVDEAGAAPPRQRIPGRQRPEVVREHRIEAAHTASRRDEGRPRPAEPRQPVKPAQLALDEVRPPHPAEPRPPQRAADPFPANANHLDARKLERPLPRRWPADADDLPPPLEGRQDGPPCPRISR